MIYLSGAVRPEVMKREDLGFMLTPHIGNKVDLDGTVWGADNGCFARPEAFVLDEYLAWLAARPAPTCLFATAPDVLGNAVATLNRSISVLPKIRAVGYKAALVAQDGLERCYVPWSMFDVLFIGGSTAWKESPAALALMAEAKSRGKWVHVGRVNSYRRLRMMADAGADSTDGTFLAFGPTKNLPRLIRWLDRLDRERRLDLVG